MNAVAMRSARTATVSRASSSSASKAAAIVARAAPLAASAPNQRRSDVRRRSALVSAQAEAEASAAAPSEAAEPEAEAAPASSTDDDASAAAAAASAAGAPSARFGLNFLWLDKNVGVAVDALYARAAAPSEGGGSSGASARAPLTEYFMWPRKDAWEELKAALEAKPWVPERDRVLLLNRTTEVINFWQDEGAKHSVEEAREKFPDCVFSSS